MNQRTSMKLFGRPWNQHLGRNTELFQEFLQDEDQDCKPDGSWGKKSAMALQNFLMNEDLSEFAALYKGHLAMIWTMEGQVC